MISQADIQTISAVFGKPADDISGAISSENEVSLDLRLNGRVISQDDERTLKESSVQQGKEIASKELARALDITLDAGEKDPAKIADKLRTSLSASLEDKYKNQTPGEELEKALAAKLEAENKVNALLETVEKNKTTIDDWSSKYSDLENQVHQNSINTELRKYLKTPDKAGLTYDQQILLLRNDVNIENDDKGYYGKDSQGNIIMDAVGNRETIENIVKLWNDKQTFTKSRSGMGGSDRNGGNGLPTGMSDDQAMQYLKDKNIDAMSPEGLEMFTKITTKQ